MSRELTYDEAAERLGVSRGMIGVWVSRGLPTIRVKRVGGSGYAFSVRIDEDVLLEFDRAKRQRRRARHEAARRREAEAAAKRERAAAERVRLAWAREATIWEQLNPALAFSRDGHTIDPRTGWCGCMDGVDQ